VQPDSPDPQPEQHPTEDQITEDQTTEGQTTEGQFVDPVRSWPVGTVVRLLQRPSYLKTADPMPMLRPPDLIGVDEVGQVVEQRALGQLAVRFRRGTFLLDAAACAPTSD